MQTPNFFSKHNPGKTSPIGHCEVLHPNTPPVLVRSSCSGGAGQRVLEVFEVESFQMVPKLHKSILAYLFFWKAP